MKHIGIITHKSKPTKVITNQIQPKQQEVNANKAIADADDQTPPVRT